MAVDHEVTCQDQARHIVSRRPVREWLEFSSGRERSAALMHLVHDHVGCGPTQSKFTSLFGRGWVIAIVAVPAALDGQRVYGPCRPVGPLAVHHSRDPRRSLFYAVADGATWFFALGASPPKRAGQPLAPKDLAGRSWPSRRGAGAMPKPRRRRASDRVEQPTRPPLQDGDVGMEWSTTIAACVERTDCAPSGSGAGGQRC